MGKRAAGHHQGHVASQTAKLAKGMDRMDAVEDQVSRKAEIKELTAQLQDDKSGKLLRRCKQAVKIAKVKTDDADRFADDLEGRALKRVPQTFLRDKWAPSLAVYIADFGNEKFRIQLWKRDSRVGHKLVTRLHLVTEEDPLGPLDKADWLHVYGKRLAQCGGWPAGLVINDNFEVNFDGAGGHFALRPELPDGFEDPTAHRYSHMMFLGKSFPLLGPLSLDGTTKVLKNWDHDLAYVMMPAHKKHWEFCKVYLKEALNTMVRTMFRPLEDKSVVSVSAAVVLHDGQAQDVKGSDTKSTGQTLGASGDAETMPPAASTSEPSLDSAAFVSTSTSLEQTPPRPTPTPTPASLSGAGVVGLVGLTPPTSSIKRKRAHCKQSERDALEAAGAHAKTTLAIAA